MNDTAVPSLQSSSKVSLLRCTMSARMHSVGPSLADINFGKLGNDVP